VEAARYAAPGETGCFFPPARNGSGDRLADAPFTIERAQRTTFIYKIGGKLRLPTSAILCGLCCSYMYTDPDTYIYIYTYIQTHIISAVDTLSSILYTDRHSDMQTYRSKNRRIHSHTRTYMYAHLHNSCTHTDTCMHTHIFIHATVGHAC